MNMKLFTIVFTTLTLASWFGYYLLGLSFERGFGLGMFFFMSTGVSAAIAGVVGME